VVWCCARGGLRRVSPGRQLSKAKSVQNYQNDLRSMQSAFPRFDTLDFRLLPAAFLTSGMLVGSQALAQEVALVSEKDFLSEMPIVLSVSRLPQRLDETPGAVTILDREMIRNSGARDVADLLRFVPGFQVSNSFESVAPLVSYHGAFDSYSNRLELLIDGRSAYSPYFIGSIGPGLETVALEDIERIEVLRGSNSAAYGARAMLGVINIVTRDTADTLGVQGAVTVGDNGIRDTLARLGWGDGTGTYRLTADTRADDGLQGANGQNRVSRINFRSDIRPNGVDEIQVRLGAMNIDSGKGKDGVIGNPRHDFSFDSSYAQVDWRRSLGEDADLALKLSHSQETYKDEFPFQMRNISPYYSVNDIYTVRASGESSSDDVSLQYTWRQSPALRLVVGGEFRSESVRSYSAYNTDAALVTDFYRLFGNLEWRATPTVLVNAGAMAEKASYSDASLAPRLMINWHATSAQTWRAGISKAFRPPSTYENFANVHYRWTDANPLLSFDQTSLRGPGNLLSEEVVSREIGYLGEFPDLGLNLDVRVFREEISNFIRQVNGGTARTYANDESFVIKGLEYQAKWQPWQGSQFILNQTYTDITSVNPGSALAAPQLATSLSYFQTLPGQMNLTLTHTESSKSTSFGGNDKDAQASQRTDLRLAKALRWGTHRGEIALVVQNLGAPYMDYKKEFSFHRQAFVTLRLDD